MGKSKDSDYDINSGFVARIATLDMEAKEHWNAWSEWQTDGFQVVGNPQPTLEDARNAVEDQRVSRNHERSLPSKMDGGEGNKGTRRKYKPP